MLYVRIRREITLLKGKQTNDEETMEKQAILFPARDRKMQVGNVFELCKHMEYKQIICCTVNKWTILKGLTIEVHDIFNRC